jgi:IclR family mhp operon transcriptional activator
MAKRSSSASYRQVQGLLRGIQVLRALNSNPGGRGSVVRISAETGIHRTTVKRLLETLRDAEIVRYLPDANEYGLTLNVLQLSEGFRDAVWVSEVARPLMHTLTHKVLWPSDLMILDTDELIVRETTHGITPWSFNSRVLGVHVPILQSAGGHAYLAYCADAEREQLLAMLRGRAGVEGQRARDPDYIARLIDITRQRGYALSERNEWVSKRFGTGRCSAVAVPIRKEGVSVASLNIVYLNRAISTEEVIARHLPELIVTGKRIEAGLLVTRTDGETRRKPVPRLTRAQARPRRGTAAGRSRVNQQ